VTCACRSFFGRADTGNRLVGLLVSPRSWQLKRHLEELVSDYEVIRGKLRVGLPQIQQAIPQILEER
jgi:hypothetical protein